MAIKKKDITVTLSVPVNEGSHDAHIIARMPEDARMLGELFKQLEWEPYRAVHAMTMLLGSLPKSQLLKPGMTPELLMEAIIAGIREVFAGRLTEQIGKS